MRCGEIDSEPAPVQDKIRRPAGPTDSLCRCISRACWIQLLLFLGMGTASAQADEVETSSSAIMVCELRDPHAAGPGHRFVASAPSQTVHVRRGATFEVTYSGFPAEAEIAFQAAVDIWEQHIASPVPIRIRANWIPLSANILGTAGPFLIRNFEAAPIPNTWYPAPLANALAGLDLDSSTPEIEATFNSNFLSWYFGTDGMPPPDLFDLTTIVLHEIGHGLGFIGSFRVDRGLGTIGVLSNPGVPFVFDRFAEDFAGRSLLDGATYPPNSSTLADVLRTGAFLGGATVDATHGRSVPLFSPPQWNDGSSFSHLDEAAFPAGDADGLLTPFLERAEVIRSPGPVVCAALQDLGWVLAPACAALIEDPVPEPLQASFSVSRAGPNPFADETALRLGVGQSQVVSVRLVDRLGRVVSRQDRFVQGGESVILLIDGEGLPAGVYLAYLVGETFAVSRAVTKLQ